MKIDTFEALKGNVKILDLDLAIENLFNQAVAYTDQYRTEEDKIKFQTAVESGWWHPNFQSFSSEPPAGKKKAYNQRVKAFEIELHKLYQARRQILELTYLSHCDDDDIYEYTVEVTVRRTLKE